MMYAVEILVLLVCVSLSMEVSPPRPPKPPRPSVYLPPPPPPPIRVPNYWIKFGRKSYQRSTSKALYAEAFLACSQLGGKLARPSNEAENRVLFNLIKGNAWLGVNDIVTEGLYVDTASRDEICYSNWNKGEPNNVRNEDCVEMYYSTGQWNDISCKYRKRQYVCERLYE